jgi:hypothetical protein
MLILLISLITGPDLRENDGTDALVTHFIEKKKVFNSKKL